MFATNISICEHFDSSIDTETRYYHEIYSGYIHRVHGLNESLATNFSDLATVNWLYYSVIQPYVNSSCIAKSPGKKLDQCKFNGYLNYDELCNPCEVKEFKKQCEELCVTTTGPPFGPFKLM